MKTLLYKQLRLVCHPMTPVFCLFGFMVIIPNYPYTVIFFYVMLGLFFTFLNMREQKDLYYTALLPVPKRDAVKAGCLFTALIELLSLAVLVPCALLAVRLQPGKDNLVGLDPNLALFAADPTRDIGNVATICGTMVAGRWYPGGLSAPHRKGASL